MTLGELAYGAAKSVRPQAAGRGADGIPVGARGGIVRCDAAHTYGRVRARLARQGTPIGPLDTIIGAHALSVDVILVTHNTREFARIEGLRVEDWLA